MSDDEYRSDDDVFDLDKNQLDENENEDNMADRLQKLKFYTNDFKFDRTKSIKIDIDQKNLHKAMNKEYTDKILSKIRKEIDNFNENEDSENIHRVFRFLERNEKVRKEDINKALAIYGLKQLTPNQLNDIQTTLGEGERKDYLTQINFIKMIDQQLLKHNEEQLNAKRDDQVAKKTLIQEFYNDEEAIEPYEQFNIAHNQMLQKMNLPFTQFNNQLIFYGKQLYICKQENQQVLIDEKKIYDDSEIFETTIGGAAQKKQQSMVAATKKPQSSYVAPKKSQSILKFRCYDQFGEVMQYEQKNKFRKIGQSHNPFQTRLLYSEIEDRVMRNYIKYLDRTQQSTQVLQYKHFLFYWKTERIPQTNEMGEITAFTTRFELYQLDLLKWDKKQEDDDIKRGRLFAQKKTKKIPMDNEYEQKVEQFTIECENSKLFTPVQIQFVFQPDVQFVLKKEIDMTKQEYDDVMSNFNKGLREKYVHQNTMFGVDTQKLAETKNQQEEQKRKDRIQEINSEKLEFLRKQYIQISSVSQKQETKQSLEKIQHIVHFGCLQYLQGKDNSIKFVLNDAEFDKSKDFSQQVKDKEYKSNEIDLVLKNLTLADNHDIFVLSIKQSQQVTLSNITENERSLVTFKKKKNRKWDDPVLCVFEHNKDKYLQFQNYENLDIYQEQIEIYREIHNSSCYEFYYNLEKESFVMQKCKPISDNKCLIFDCFLKRTISIEQEQQYGESEKEKGQQGGSQGDFILKLRAINIDTYGQFSNKKTYEIWLQFLKLFYDASNSFVDDRLRSRYLSRCVQEAIINQSQEPFGNYKQLTFNRKHNNMLQCENEILVFIGIKKFEKFFNQKEDDEDLENQIGFFLQPYIIKIKKRLDDVMNSNNLDIFVTEEENHGDFDPRKSTIIGQETEIIIEQDKNKYKNLKEFVQQRKLQIVKDPNLVQAQIKIRNIQQVEDKNIQNDKKNEEQSPQIDDNDNKRLTLPIGDTKQDDEYIDFKDEIIKDKGKLDEQQYAEFEELFFVYFQKIWRAQKNRTLERQKLRPDRYKQSHLDKVELKKDQDDQNQDQNLTDDEKNQKMHMNDDELDQQIIMMKEYLKYVNVEQDQDLYFGQSYHDQINQGELQSSATSTQIDSSTTQFQRETALTIDNGILEGSVKRDTVVESSTGAKPGGKSQHKNSWQVIFERVKHQDDDISMRPILIHLKRSIQEYQMVWLCIFDFENNQILALNQLDFDSMNKPIIPDQLCISASQEWKNYSSLSQNDIKSIINQDTDHSYKANYLVSIHIPDQQRIKLLEYNLEYSVKGRLGMDKIVFTGSKELILSRDLEVNLNINGHIFYNQMLKKYSRQTHLVPYFNNTNQIIGTQLIIEIKNKKEFITFQFEESKETRYDCNSLLKKQGYKLYRNMGNIIGNVHGQGVGNTQYMAILAYVSFDNFKLEQLYEHFLQDRYQNLRNRYSDTRIHKTINEIRLFDKKLKDDKDLKRKIQEMAIGKLRNQNMFKAQQQGADKSFSATSKSIRKTQKNIEKMQNKKQLLSVEQNKMVKNLEKSLKQEHFRIQQDVIDKAIRNEAKEKMIKEDQISIPEIIELIESNLRILLNTIVFDPLQAQLPLQTDKNAKQFLKQIRVGRPVECLNFMSLLTIMSLNKHYNIDDMLKECQWQDEVDDLKSNRNINLEQDLVYTSLIERILLPEIKKCEFRPEKRLNTLGIDRLRMSGNELLQRDIHYNSIFHYFLNGADVQNELLQQQLSLFFSNDREQHEANIEKILIYVFKESFQRFSYTSQEILETFTRKLIEGCKTIPDSFYENFLLQKDELMMENHKRNDKMLNIQQPVKGLQIPRELGYKSYIIFNNERSFGECDYKFSTSDEEIVTLLVEKDKEIQDEKNKKRWESMVWDQIYTSQYPVDCYVFDYRMTNYDNKIRWLMKYMDGNENTKRGYKPDMNLSFYAMNNMFYKVLMKEKNNEDSINSMIFIRCMIDHLFDSKTKVLIQAKFVFFTICFLVPYFWQQYWDDLWRVRIALCFTSLTVIGIFVSELNQAQFENEETGTLQTYFFSTNNLLELSFVFIYSIYFLQRWDKPDLNFRSSEDLLTKSPSLPVLGAILNGISILMFFNFLQVFEEMRKFLKLIQGVSLYLMKLLGLLMVFCFMQSVLLEYFGTEYQNSEEEYPELNSGLMMFMQTMRNAVGDIQYPLYEKGQSKTVLFCIWFLWSINISISFIILNNFMINMIGDEFQKIKNVELQNIYKNRLNMNFEYELIRQNFIPENDMLDREYSYVVLFSHKEERDYQGQAQEIKNHLFKMYIEFKSFMMKTKQNQLMSIQKKQKAVKKQLDYSMKQMINQVEKVEADFNQRAEDVEKQMNKIKKRVQEVTSNNAQGGQGLMEQQQDQRRYIEDEEEYLSEREDMIGEDDDF